MRKIRFRGKTQDGMWVMGYFVQYEDEAYIFPETEVAKGLDIGGYLDCCKMIQVIPETVGQFIGLYDRDDRMVFEGDIIQRYKPEFIPPRKYRKPYAVNIRSEFPPLICEYYSAFDYFDERVVYEVIGNIHDNPELLKGETNV